MLDKITFKTSKIAFGVFVIGLCTRAFSGEFPIGQPVEINGIQFAAAYLKPQPMSSKQGDLSKSDVHLEADIHATQDNKNGFEDGAWLPFLTVTYKLEKIGGKTQSGELVAMVADDGPHYGKNIPLFGQGKYKVTFTVKAPSDNILPRHTDEETGVGPWFKEFSQSYEFEYKGIK